MARKKKERRQSVNKYEGMNTPEAVLDFHDDGVITSQDVKKRTEAFIRDASTQGFLRVRIITGKGVHSKGKPVVEPQVNRTLRNLTTEGIVESYRTENDGDGGRGAIRVDLTT